MATVFRWLTCAFLVGLVLVAFNPEWQPGRCHSSPPDQAHGETAILANEVQSISYRPIPFGRERKELTLEYIRSHYDSEAKDIVIVPKMVVIHWSASSTLGSVLSSFESESLPLYRWEIRKAGKLNVSSHFVVDRDGSIYQLMPENWMARHTIGLNRVAIGIENVGGPDSPLTQAQLRANAWLVRQLAGKYPSIAFLIGHHEYTSFRGTPLWQEKDPTYVTGKNDPGPEFMWKLRELTKDIGLAGSYVGVKK